MFVTKLPDDVIHKILLFIESPVRIVHQMSTLSLVSLDFYQMTQESSNDLWEFILGGYYSAKNADIKTSKCAFQSRTQRRNSKRLRRSSAKNDVIHAHFNLRDQTEMALQEVSDMAISKIPKPLSLARLRAILNTYGPLLNIDQRSAIGGTFLVDVSKARCVKEGVILACIKELIEIYGANVNVPATEGCFRSALHLKKGNHNTLPAVVVASARGMSSVVKYFVQNHVRANLNLKGSTRFRLYTNPKKSISGCFTALEFAIKMKSAELEHGATENQLTSLSECIKILTME